MDGQNFNNTNYGGSGNDDHNDSGNNYYSNFTGSANYQDNTGIPSTSVQVAEQSGSDSGSLGVVGLVLGILSIICGCCGPLGVIMGIPGIICSIFGNKQKSSGMAIGGLICSIIGLILGFVVTIFYVMIIMVS